MDAVIDDFAAHRLLSFDNDPHTGGRRWKSGTKPCSRNGSGWRAGSTTNATI